MHPSLCKTEWWASRKQHPGPSVQCRLDRGGEAATSSAGNHCRAHSLELEHGPPPSSAERLDVMPKEGASILGGGRAPAPDSAQIKAVQRSGRLGAARS